MATSIWYLARGKQSIGPISRRELEELATTGQLHPGDLVWQEGRPDWVRADQVADLFPAGAWAPSPPPLPSPRLEAWESPLGVQGTQAKLIRPANPPKEPLAMAVLSIIIVGAGQATLGQKAKGIVMFVAALLIGLLTAGLAAPVTLLFAAIDAYMVAKKLKEGRAVGEWEFF